MLPETSSRSCSAVSVASLRGLHHYQPRLRFHVALHLAIVVIGEPGAVAVPHDVGEPARRHDVDRGGNRIHQRCRTEQSAGVRIVRVRVGRAAARCMRAAEIVTELMRHRARPLRGRIPSDRRIARHVADARHAAARPPHDTEIKARCVARTDLHQPQLAQLIECARPLGVDVEPVGHAGQRVGRPRGDRDVCARDREAARDFVEYRCRGRHRRHIPAGNQRYEH